MGLLTHWRVRVNRPRVVLSVPVVPVVPVPVGAHGHGQPQVQVELLKEVGKTRPLVVSRRTCSAAVMLAPLAPQPYLLGSGDSEAHPGHGARLLPLRVPHGGLQTLAKPFSTVFPPEPEVSLRKIFFFGRNIIFIRLRRGQQIKTCGCQRTAATLHRSQNLDDFLGRRLEGGFGDTLGAYGA